MLLFKSFRPLSNVSKPEALVISLSLLISLLHCLNEQSIHVISHGCAFSQHSTRAGSEEFPVKKTALQALNLGIFSLYSCGILHEFIIGTITTLQLEADEQPYRCTAHWHINEREDYGMKSNTSVSWDFFAIL